MEKQLLPRLDTSSVSPSISNNQPPSLHNCFRFEGADEQDPERFQNPHLGVLERAEMQKSPLSFRPSALNMQPVNEANNRGALAAVGRPCNFPTSIRAGLGELSMDRIDSVTVAAETNLAPDPVS